MRRITKSELFDEISMIYAEYGDEWDAKEIDARVELWYAKLSAYPCEVVLQAISNVICKSEYKPRLANVCNEIERLRSLTLKTDEQLWEELSATFFEVAQNANGYKYNDGVGEDGKRGWQRCMERNEAIYNALSPEIREFVRNVSELVVLAQMPAEQRAYERVRFGKRIGEIRQRIKNLSETPREILTLLSASAPQLSTGRKMLK